MPTQNSHRKNRANGFCRGFTTVWAQGSSNVVAFLLPQFDLWPHLQQHPFFCEQGRKTRSATAQWQWHDLRLCLAPGVGHLGPTGHVPLLSGLLELVVPPQQSK